MASHEERYCRLTASNFGAVIMPLKSPEACTVVVIGQDCAIYSSSNKMGREHHKSVAFEVYLQIVGARYANLTLHKCGFYTGNPAYLGASPDGVLVDESDTVIGIIKIKCPYSAAKLTVREACIHCSDFYCSLNDDGEVKLNNNHAYYYQVLGMMAVTEAQFCDFIIWTPKSTEILNIKKSGKEPLQY